MTPNQRDAVHRTVTLLGEIHLSEFGSGRVMPDPTIIAGWIERLTRQGMLLRLIPELSFSTSPRRGFRSLLDSLPRVGEILSTDVLPDRDAQETLREAHRYAKNAIGEHDQARAEGIDILHAAKVLARAKEALADAHMDMDLTIRRAADTGRTGREDRR
jgi:hypothetical protein